MAIRLIAALSSIAVVSATINVTGVSNYCITDHIDETSATAASFRLSTAQEFIESFCTTYIGSGVTSWDRTVTANSYIWHPRIQACFGYEASTVTPEDCQTYFVNAINNCDLTTTDNKMGNVLSVSGNDGDYCMMYGIWAEAGTAAVVVTETVAAAPFNTDTAIQIITAPLSGYTPDAGTPATPASVQ